MLRINVYYILIVLTRIPLDRPSMRELAVPIRKGVQVEPNHNDDQTQKLWNHQTQDI